MASKTKPEDNGAEVVNRIPDLPNGKPEALQGKPEGQVESAPPKGTVDSFAWQAGARHELREVEVAQKRGKEVIETLKYALPVPLGSSDADALKAIYARYASEQNASKTTTITAKKRNAITGRRSKVPLTLKEAADLANEVWAKQSK